MKRLLVVTYYWPPEGGSGVQRWVKFARYLRDCGWEPVIYTPQNPEISASDPALSEELPEGLEVLRRPIREPYAAYRRLTGGGSTRITELASGAKSNKSRLALFISGNFFIPDPRRSWVRPSVKFLSKWLREHPVDAVVTTGPPHSMHLIGRGLHRGTGLPWVADFRDPWTKMFYFRDLRLLPFARCRHFRLEQSVLDEASAVVAVSPQVRDDFASRTKTRVELITNGYDAADFKGPAPERDTEHFRVAHTGLLGADGNPALLWKVLADKCAADPELRRRLQLRLAGKVDAAVVVSVNAAGLEDNLVLTGYLPHEETVIEQRSADLLLLPLREGPEGGKIVPGKIFEYLAARRPVLGIGDPAGSAAGILAECGSGTMCFWTDETGLAAAVDAAWDRFRAGTAASRDGLDASTDGHPAIGNSSVERYSRQALTARYAALLDSLL